MNEAEELSNLTTMAFKEGFQKGKLEKKKEDLKVIEKSRVMWINYVDITESPFKKKWKVIFNDLHKQLQKEIGDNSHSSQSGSKMNDKSVTNSVIDCSLKSSGSDTQPQENNFTTSMNREVCWEDGFQKGKLEQKKEDILEHLEFFKDLLFSYNSRWFKEKIEKRIKQLQKEIGGNSR